MEPVIALLGVTLVVFVVTQARFEIALRAGVAAMVALTGVAHFTTMRADLVAMVHRGLATLAATGLTLLLVAILPANVTLALSGEPLHWWDELVPRTVMQTLFLTATIAVVVLTRRQADDVPAGTS